MLRGNLNEKNLPRIRGWLDPLWLTGSDRYGSLLHVSCTRLGLTAASYSEDHEWEKEIGECIIDMLLKEGNLYLIEEYVFACEVGRKLYDWGIFCAVDIPTELRSNIKTP